MAENIAGKVIVITGASSGMGEAAARHLAAKGASVVLGRAAPTESKRLRPRSPQPPAKPWRSPPT